MKNDIFAKVVAGQFKTCEDVLVTKSVEYTDTYEDKLAQFKTAGALQHVNPKAALFGMLAKHFCSLSDMCRAELTVYPIDAWQEKITDSINYLLLLKGLVIEEEAQRPQFGIVYEKHEVNDGEDKTEA